MTFESSGADESSKASQKELFEVSALFAAADSRERQNHSLKVHTPRKGALSGIRRIKHLFRSRIDLNMIRAYWPQGGCSNSGSHRSVSFSL